MLTAPDEAEGFVNRAVSGQTAGQRCAYLKLLLGATTPALDELMFGVRDHPCKCGLLSCVYRAGREPLLNKVPSSACQNPGAGGAKMPLITDRWISGTANWTPEERNRQTPEV